MAPADEPTSHLPSSGKAEQRVEEQIEQDFAEAYQLLNKIFPSMRHHLKEHIVAASSLAVAIGAERRARERY